eukprot:3734394-Rhodomonas_salina.1
MESEAESYDEEGKPKPKKSEADLQAELMRKKLETRKKFDSEYDGIEDNEELVAQRAGPSHVLLCRCSLVCVLHRVVARCACPVPLVRWRVFAAVCYPGSATTPHGLLGGDGGGVANSYFSGETTAGSKRRGHSLTWRRQTPSNIHTKTIRPIYRDHARS